MKELLKLWLNLSNNPQADELYKVNFDIPLPEMRPYEKLPFH